MERTSACSEGLRGRKAYEVEVLSDQLCTCRDGVRLAADVYLPECSGGGAQGGDGAARRASYPVLLQRTPYNKLGLAREGLWYAERGYAVVLQDVRGRFASEGLFEPFLHEAEDGFDTVAWLLEQPWCNGRVGTMGTSYLACTQAALGTLNPPGLAAQFVSQGFANYHTTRSRRGGAYENHRTHWLFRMARDSKEAAADPALRAAADQAWEHLDQWISPWPMREGLNPLSALPTYERALFDFMTRGDYDTWWHNPALSLEPYYETYPDIPVYFLGSWYDPYAVAVTDNYVALAGRGKGPVRLLMGPWVHGVEALAAGHAGDVEFGDEARLAYDQLRLAWFDRWLKDVDDPYDLDANHPVRIFVMGGGTGRKTPDGRIHHGGRWRGEHGWPIERTVPSRLFLTSDGGLSERPPTTACATSYRYDPLDPQPSAPDPRNPKDLFARGGFDLRGHAAAPFCRDGRPLAARHDVLVYATGILNEPVEVTGRAKVTLWVSSTGVDTDFTARLVDWYPPNPDYPEGYGLELCQTIQRARYRASREHAELMTPGEVYELTLLLPPTSNLFMAGHRIRVDISSSDFPRFDVNPNTGEPLGRHRRCEVVTNTVHYGPDAPSAVLLPVVR